MRITKADLQKTNESLVLKTAELRKEIYDLKEKIAFLEKYAQVRHFNSYVIAHAHEVNALCHAVTGLSNLIQRRMP